MFKPLWFLGLISGLMWGGVACAAPRHITLVADEWCPYNCAPTDEKAPGFLVEVVKEALEPLGYKVIYAVEPWTRAEKDVLAGRYDMLIATDPVENPDLKFAREPAAVCSFRLFTLPEKAFVYTGIESLIGRRLGAIEDYLYSPELNAYMQAHRKEQEHIQILSGNLALDRNIKKLMHDRIDVLVETPAVLRYRMKEMGVSATLVEVGGIDQNNRLCQMGISPNITDADELQYLLETRTQTLRADGTLAQLRKKYALE